MSAEGDALRADDRRARLWALLFASGRPVARTRLALLLAVTETELDALADSLAVHLGTTGAPFHLERLVSGYHLVLDPAHHALARALVGEAPARLSEAVLETLAVVVYRQPASRAMVEAARGVRADRSLAVLLERDLVHEVGTPPGQRREDGPFYATTRAFLDAFGLVSLADLPPWPGAPTLPRQGALEVPAWPPGADTPALPTDGEGRNPLP